MKTHQDKILALLPTLVRYEPDTGKLFWLPRDESLFPSFRSFKTWNTRFANKEIKCKNGVGYYQARITVDSEERAYLVHHLVWALLNGDWPVKQIDHIDHDGYNNRADNLREVSHKENGRNRSKKKTNISGFNGVHWAKNSSKWRAEIKVDGKKIHLGVFLNLEDAIKARAEADAQYGFHPNHGIIC